MNLQETWDCLAQRKDQYLDVYYAVDTGTRTLNPKVIWLNKQAVSRDFDDSFSSIQAKTGIPKDKLLFDWLINTGSVISNYQVQENPVNDELDVTGELVQMIRPPRYGRAAVVRCDEREPFTSMDGYVDVKGCGVFRREPSISKSHANGLLNLPEALRELLSQHLVEYCLRKEGLNIAGVPVYGLLFLGFDYRIAGHAPAPAVSMVRRAHTRKLETDIPDKDSVEWRVYREIELALRKYGVTSTSNLSALNVRLSNGTLSCTYGDVEMADISHEHLKILLSKYGLEAPVTFYFSNIQSSDSATLNPLSAQLIDFGQYAYQTQFSDPLVFIANDQPFNIGEVMLPDDQAWVQPNPKRRLNEQYLRPFQLNASVYEWAGMKPKPVKSYTAGYALQLAFDIVYDHLSSDEVQQRIDAFVNNAFDAG